MKLRRILVIAGLLVLLVSCPALAAPTDPATRGEACALLLQAADYYQPGLTAADIMRGDAQGELREDEPVTRAEALVMLQRAFGPLPQPLGDNARKAYPAANFTDVPDWAATELESVLAAGIVAGVSATAFSPQAYVTGQQLELFIDRTYALLGANLKDDFYATVNKVWLDKSQVKPGYSLSGAIYDLMYDTQPLTRLIDKAVAKPRTEDEQRIAALYGNILDWEGRNAAGLDPIRPYLTAVDEATSLAELMQVHHQVSTDLGGGLLLNFGLTIDALDSNSYVVTFAAGSPSMTKELYAQDGGSQKEAYLQYVQTLFQLGGVRETAAAADAQTLWAMEKAISPSRLETWEYGDVAKTNNIYSLEQLKKLFPEIDLGAVYADSGLKPTDRIVVSDKGLLEAVAPYFTAAHFEELKIWMRLNLLSAYGSYLSRDFQDAAQAFSEAFLGVQGQPSDEEAATQQVQSLLGDELSHLYAAAYFSPQAKADVEDMVRDVIAVYKERLMALEWMSAETKAKAVAKLDAMGVKVGYPDEGCWNDFLKGVTLNSKEQGGSYFQNIIAITQAQQDLILSWQDQPVNKDMWAMNVFTVNACYVPSNNEIVFPAGILQAPVYDVKASREENLGGIGYVIAHEITHAFDNNGAKYDKDGNAADWWTAADYAAFQALCQQVVAYYDGKEIAPGVSCNGALTLSENIADLGAASCILEVAQREKDPDLDLLFRSMARTWASTANREMASYLTQLDVHSPDKLRGTLPLQSLDAFYTTYDIQPGDGMYLAPEERIAIW